MSPPDFKLIGSVRKVEVIASGRGVRSADRLRQMFGSGRWRKLKGEATIEEADGNIREVELHWYEAHGIGRRGWKIKKYLD